MPVPANIPHPSIPPIRCAVCDRPVERVHAEISELMHCIEITVWCHGETDSMQLTQRFLAEGEEQIMREGGIAFQHTNPVHVLELAHG